MPNQLGQNQVSKYLAVINEDQCIGCTLCIKACPFDAIIGAAKHMHAVITAYCTGCKLCVAPCPVDCISMIDNAHLKSDDMKEQKKSFAQAARQRKQQHEHRLNARQQSKQKILQEQKSEIEDLLAKLKQNHH